LFNDIIKYNFGIKIINKFKNGEYNGKFYKIVIIVVYIKFFV